MTKKLLIIVSLLFSLLFISTASFATRSVNDNMVHNTSVTNALHNATAGAINGTNNLIHNTATHIENATTHGRTNTVRTTSPYRTTRTATNDAANAQARTNRTVTWVVISIAAVVIVGLIWYYASQDVRRDR